ncbi:hypothetical protein GMOD_00007872 [Pyrenophora seminiperda CCB06]|uniref:Uncharacterized protein n=1 Tax=Pyrenophora seminiperda CCB06 TaxID=1302712 RepID=A0A3M7MFQ2_9PLEO|nr:hypothetical protein GMOD_00007872 [Pyrenophora seminiperda CCB06]
MCSKSIYNVRKLNYNALEKLAYGPALEYNATVSWIVLNPRPDMVFATDGNPPSLTRHSVLWIQQKSENISLIFDGTAEQFGWAASNAISNTYDYLKQFTALEDSYFKYGDLKDVGDEIQGHDRGYWLEAIPKLLGLWRRLDWELLEAVPARARLEYIRRAADQEFRIIAARKWDNTISK